MNAPVHYEVQARFNDEATARRWEAWLRDKHIAYVVAAGAREGHLLRVDADAPTLVAQYGFDSRAALERYLADHAPRLRAEGTALFPPDQVTYTRRIAERIT